MTNPNGFYSIQGTQVFTAANNRCGLGPFNTPFGSVSDSTELTLSAGTFTYGVPGGSNGVAIIPPIGAPPAGVTLKMKTVLADSGTFISTQYPTVIEWDVTNSEVPADLYLVASGSIVVVVQFI